MHLTHLIEPTLNISSSLNTQRLALNIVRQAPNIEFRTSTPVRCRFAHEFQCFQPVGFLSTPVRWHFTHEFQHFAPVGFTSAPVRALCADEVRPTLNIGSLFPHAISNKTCFSLKINT